ncbi:MAG: hypothetical protein ABI600_12365 [Luteolibacter sp.]
MKTILKPLISILLGCVFASGCFAQTYTNFIRQVQLPSNVQYDATVVATGSQLSALSIDPGGATFQLWTVKSSPLTNYLLDSAYVGAYVPLATVTVRSEDPYTTIPRTRCDRPFYVDYTVSGLLSGATDPDASKSVTLLRHVQSYGTNGTGIGIDRTQATLLSQATVNTNGAKTLSYTLTSVPNANRSKVRGEERFSLFSLADYQADASQLASKFIQIWPVADGSITGIANSQYIRYALPTVTLSINDIYPSATVYAQVYRGSAVLGTEGTVVPGSSLVINDTLPQSRVLTLNNYDSAFDSDGVWTMELLTTTPFGTDRLAFVTFNLTRTLKLNGTVVTME